MSFRFFALVPLAVACLGAASPSPEPSATVPPEVAQLRAKVDAARGKRPVNERIVETLDEDGRTSTRVTVREGDDVRVRYSDGPFHTESGTFGGQNSFKRFSAIVIGSDHVFAGGDSDGIIGPERLRYFTVTTEYANSSIYLLPNNLGYQAKSR